MGEPPQAVVMKTFGEADKTCEEKIQSHLQSLRKVLAAFLDWRASEEKRHQDYLETSEAKRRRIEAEFERLRRLLAEQERTALGRLAELDNTFTATHAEKSLRVAKGVAQLHRLIGQLEACCLSQDAGSILSSEVRLHLPSGLPKELEKSLSSCCRQSDALWEALEKFRDTDPTMGLPTAEMTLETGTTPLPQLLEERKSVQWDEGQGQDEGREPR
ncbi:PREDICTED: E3 ubiquitin-protein ligase TRIM11-like [Pseudopodoces humilis]|uniref:E3 ubiquitin-protein ligase TRIM11-like n=1 Tax=Pseudopodoces humilis TaxID=181119 RepID=UPI0006B76C07|nr:PREDICTED: E3 ubiquitin-protein ligase TRIM11-like [Pseudopodoces humilis]